MMNKTKNISVEICYATEKEYFLEKINLPENSTVSAAIEMSRVLERFPEINLTNNNMGIIDESVIVNKVGIFGELVTLDSILEDKDRVEIYRPLAQDPKLLRQQRAKSKKAKERALEQAQRISRKSQKSSESDQ